MMTYYYARVTAERNERVHLAEVPTRNRSFLLEGLQTLCKRVVTHSFEGVEDAADCPTCLAREKARPRPRRSVEGPRPRMKSSVRKRVGTRDHARSGAFYLEMSLEDRSTLERLVVHTAVRYGRPITRAEVVRDLIRAAASVLE